MKVIKTSCLGCGRIILADADKKECVCPHCGKKFLSSQKNPADICESKTVRIPCDFDFKYMKKQVTRIGADDEETIVVK